ncbi:hypothetical protein CDAR_266501 [Caerostris darwini]|uniref:Protein SMG5 n=1 Tax=Caerostris darwini TaxID=1538125 RepID=A0AAV4TII4_9ARAC|nr:hypothetical protein CDAR_266501 [Caerostris darwini]
MKSIVAKDINLGNDASKRLYRGALEAARKLEQRLVQGSSLSELFSTEVTELRKRVKDYCERLIFAEPVEYGKKAEDLLWRKVYYEFFWRCKQNRKKFMESDFHKSSLKNHLLAGIGFYHHLQLRIQTEFHLNLEGKADVPLLWQIKGIKKERWKKYQLSAATDENVLTWAEQAIHRILIYLGDLERYISELDEPESVHLAERFYQQAFCINSANGTPHNQLGSLYSNRFDSAYHYMRCVASQDKFDGAENNLFHLFDKNEEVVTQLYLPESIEKESLKCSRFLSRFIKLCQIFYVKHYENYDAQTYCQDILKEFNIAHNTSFEDAPQKEDSDAWLSDDIVYKVVIMSLLCVWKTQQRGALNASVAISFSFAFFSYVVQRINRQLLSALLGLKSTEVLQNGCKIENEEKLLKHNSKEQLSDTGGENEINADFIKKRSSKKGKKFSAPRLCSLRRRRKLSNTSQDDSELSEGEMSDLLESDEESGLLNSDVSQTGSCSSESLSEHEDDLLLEENGLSNKGESVQTFDKNYNLSNGSSKCLNDIEFKEANKKLQKSSFKDVNSILEDATIPSEKFIEILRQINLFPCLKILTDWLKINENILSAGAVTSAYLLSCLTELLNVLIKIEGRLPNLRERLLQQNNGDIFIQDFPLPEDIALQSFPLLKEVHSKLSFDVSRRRKLSTSEQVYIRIQCILSFGNLLIKASESLIAFDTEKKYYLTVKNKAKESNKEENNTSKPSSHGPDGQKKQLMSSMAQLWLKSEVDNLETFFEAPGCKLSPILVTDASILSLNLQSIKQLVKTKMFIVVVPLTVIATLDLLKKESTAAREAMRWLESEMTKGGRNFRAQNPVEKISLLPRKYPRKKDKEAWDFYQILECCNYFAQQQQTNSKPGCHLVTLLVGSLNQLPENAIPIAQSIDVTIEKLGCFLSKWRAVMKKPG